jgi:hypothetical protein
MYTWRRRAGLATLMAAICLTSPWIRSFYICDIIEIPPHEIASTGGGIIWNRLPFITPVGWTSDRTPLADWNNHGKWWHFESGHWIIPYWVIVLPIAILAAYQILWKPRK